MGLTVERFLYFSHGFLFSSSGEVSMLPQLCVLANHDRSPKAVGTENCGAIQLWEHTAVCSELRSCAKEGVDVLVVPVPNSPYGLCGRKATLNGELYEHTADPSSNRTMARVNIEI